MTESYMEMFQRELTVPTFAGDAAGDAAMVEAGKPALEVAAKLAGWDVADVRELHPNGMLHTNARVWNHAGRYIDVKLPAGLL
jgi:hypothetical protein